jgi:membrane protease YdiL (CAAX protease family)
MGIQIPENPVPVVVEPFLFLLFILFAYCEEVGWQGYIFGPMEEKWNALRASIVLGTIGVIWHLPLFVIQNPPGGIIWITGHFLDMVLIRILTVWIFNNTGKSVFATALFHAVYNLCTTVLFPIYNSPFGPMITNILLIVTIVIVIYFWGSDTLSHFRFRKRDWKHSPSHSYSL